MAAVKVARLDFDDWIGGRSLPTVGSNAGAAALAFQSWRRFKEAFAPELVERAVRETPGPVRRIVDPFGGSGTTALAAQFLGVHPLAASIIPSPARVSASEQVKASAPDWPPPGDSAVSPRTMHERADRISPALSWRERSRHLIGG